MRVGDMHWCARVSVTSIALILHDVRAPIAHSSVWMLLRYRMFAHKANPMEDEGDGVVGWTPYRDRRGFGAMYFKVLGLLAEYFRQSLIG